MLRSLATSSGSRPLAAALRAALVCALACVAPGRLRAQPAGRAAPPLEVSGVRVGEYWKTSLEQIARHNPALPRAQRWRGALPEFGRLTSGFRLRGDNLPGLESETFALELTPPPLDGRVVAVYRGWQSKAGEEETVASLVAALRAKYGPESYRSDEGVIKLYWRYDPETGALARTVPVSTAAACDVTVELLAQAPRAGAWAASDSATAMRALTQRARTCANHVAVRISPSPANRELAKSAEVYAEHAVLRAAMHDMALGRIAELRARGRAAASDAAARRPSRCCE